jgi:hypothetical protein
MKKNTSLTALFLISLLALSIVGTIEFGRAQTYKEVNGIISSDTTWTKPNSPYTLTGPVLIKSGVTLTIEPGVTVNLGNYYIQVNGTLNARGTVSDNIFFNGGASIMPGAIAFTKFSPSWSEQSEKGSIIENAVVNNSSIAISIGDTSPKINNNTITGQIWTADANTKGLLTESTPIITNNILCWGLALQINTSPIIINNTIKGDIRTGSGYVVISGNYIEGSIESSGEKDQITNNIVLGKGGGTGIRTGFSVIENNLISNFYDAIKLGVSPIIRNNTITNNVNAISVPGYLRSSYNPQIYWNNIYNNSGYNINLYTDETHPANSINATYNWWGTTDSQAISQKIHDVEDDFNLGKVTFTPALNAPNPQAPTLPDATPLPTAAPTSSQTPTATPDHSDAQSGVLYGLDWEQTAILLLGVVVVLLICVVVFLRKRNTK